MRERSWFSIYEEDGVKMVCFHGFMYPYWKDDLWSFVYTRGACFPLSELLASDDWGEREEVMAHCVENSRQYQGEYSEAAAFEVRNGYYDGDEGIEMCLYELSMDTPIGNYWTEE